LHRSNSLQTKYVEQFATNVRTQPCLRRALRQVENGFGDFDVAVVDLKARIERARAPLRRRRETEPDRRYENSASAMQRVKPEFAPGCKTLARSSCYVPGKEAACRLWRVKE